MTTRRRTLVGWLVFLVGFALFGGTSALSLYAAISGVPVDEISYQIQDPGAVYLTTDDYGTSCTFTGPGSASLADKNTGVLPRTNYTQVRVVRVEITARATVRCTGGTATLTRGFITRLYPLGENEYVAFGYMLVMITGVVLIRRAGEWRLQRPTGKTRRRAVVSSAP